MRMPLKQILIALSVVFHFTAQAQTNVFHDRAFWKTNPDIEKVNAEIKKGHSATELTRSGFDATVYAILDGAPDATVKYLLDMKGNEVTKLTHDSRNYLHWAANKGNVEIMEYVLKKGARTDQQDSHGYTPLNFAAANGQANTKVYDLLLSRGARLGDLDEHGANALLLIAPSDKDFLLVNYFVSKGLDLKSKDADGNTVFSYVARTGNIDALKNLLSKGVPFTDEAMLFASQGFRNTANKLDVFTYLESLGIKPTAVNKEGNNALHYILRRGKDLEVIRYFISKGVDVNAANKDGNTPFMNAAMNNTPDILTEVLPHVKNLQAVNKKGVSALAMAVQYNTPETVQLLIDKGASVNTTDAAGNNLAFYLMESQNADAFDAKLKALKQAGLVITAPQKNGNTLFHLAVEKNNLDLIKRVSQLGIDVNAKNLEGYSPLHKAAMMAQDDTILKYLISIGAKKEVVTDFKETAYTLATENELLIKNKVSIDFLK